MKNFFSRLFADSKALIVKHLENSVLELSRLDGKAGLSAEDLYLIYVRIQSVQANHASSTGLQRAQLVAKWIDLSLGDHIPDNVSNIIVKFLFDAAKLSGKIK